ncbi:MAG: toxin-antitoxin system HicB family antitoxin [Chloroflexota bacterium]
MPYKYSGHIRLRIPPSLHKLLRDRAIVEDVSLNQYMTSALARSVGIDAVKEKKAPSKVGVREKRARYRSSK